MTARFVHLGDLHLQSTHPQNEDRKLAIEHAVAEQVDLAAWLFPGDLFHARSTVDDRNFLASVLQTMANRAPVVICYGNHDAPGDLEVFSKLQARYLIHVVSTPQVLDLMLADRTRALVFVLPYPSKAGLVAAGLQRDDLHQATQNAMDLIFMDAAGKLDAARKEGRITLMMGHVNVAGSVSSVGQPQIGGELEITQDHLDRLGGIPKLLNHIHKHQEVGGAHYAGSLCRLDWGEVEPKGYQVVDFERAGKTDVGPPYWQATIAFVPLDVPPMYHVEGKVDGNGRFDFKVTRGPGGEELLLPKSLHGCDVRVRVMYPAAERALLSARMVNIRDTFSAARRCVIEPIVMPDRALRAPEVVEARTFEDKLKAWAKLTGVEWSDEIDRCAQELLADEQQASLAHEVEQRLRPLADVSALLQPANQLVEVGGTK